MKKKYEEPSIRLAMFRNENIAALSGTNADAVTASLQSAMNESGTGSKGITDYNLVW